MRHSLSLLLIPAVVLLVATPMAHASLLTLPNGGSAAESDNAALPAGSFFQQAQTMAFSATDFNGVYTENAYLNSVGELFTFIINLSANSAHGIETVSLSDFTGFNVWVGGCTACTGSGTVAPTGYNRNGPGSTVNVQFNPAELNPGQKSIVIFVQTNAPVIVPGNFSAINSFTTTVADMAPGVPEPGTLGTFAIGGGLLLAGVLKRRAGNKKENAQ
jgi:hypothetical protein